MAKNETPEKTVGKVNIHDVSVQDLVAYKKIADIMFEYYSDWAKSFVGEYDELTKSRYDSVLQDMEFYRGVRESVRTEMEDRLRGLEL